MLPDFLALGTGVIENDDVLALVVKSVEKACRGAIPRANGRAGREPVGIDLVMSRRQSW